MTLDRLRERYRARRRRLAIARVRAQLAYFGIDTRHLSDDELVERVCHIQDGLRECGITASEAADAFRDLGRAAIAATKAADASRDLGGILKHTTWRIDE